MSRQFAELTGDHVREKNSECGHQAFLYTCAGEESGPVFRGDLW